MAHLEVGFGENPAYGGPFSLNTYICRSSNQQAQFLGSRAEELGLLKVNRLALIRSLKIEASGSLFSILTFNSFLLLPICDASRAAKKKITRKEIREQAT